jgi:hypothetical protein
MKLRMRKNSLRLRLTRSEIALFAEAGFVEEAVEFSTGTLVYRIDRSLSAQQVTADFASTSITVVIPERIAGHWIATQQAGFKAVCGKLDILIEKDFQCEHGAPDGDSFARGEAQEEVS